MNRPQEETMSTSLVDIWRRLILGDQKSWVLFEEGTVVVLSKPGDGDLAAQAKTLMSNWGVVNISTSSGDFTVDGVKGVPGWVVSCHHPDILTYVSPDEVGGSKAKEVAVGLYGRSKRDTDARSLTVIHVEDKRERS